MIFPFSQGILQRDDRRRRQEFIKSISEKQKLPNGDENNDNNNNSCNKIALSPDGKTVEDKLRAHLDFYESGMAHIQQRSEQLTQVSENIQQKMNMSTDKSVNRRYIEGSNTVDSDINDNIVDGDGQDHNNDCHILYDNCDSPPQKERLLRTKGEVDQKEQLGFHEENNHRKQSQQHQQQQQLPQQQQKLPQQQLKKKQQEHPENPEKQHQNQREQCEKLMDQRTGYEDKQLRSEIDTEDTPLSFEESGQVTTEVDYKLFGSPHILKGDRNDGMVDNFLDMSIGSEPGQVAGITDNFVCSKIDDLPRDDVPSGNNNYDKNVTSGSIERFLLPTVDENNNNMDDNFMELPPPRREDIARGKTSYKNVSEAVSSPYGEIRKLEEEMRGMKDLYETKTKHLQLLLHSGKCRTNFYEACNSISKSALFIIGISESSSTVGI